MKRDQRLKKPRQGLPQIEISPFNQTIIINNPNININYLDQPIEQQRPKPKHPKNLMETLYHDKSTSRVLDSRNLQANLREFDETKQFFRKEEKSEKKKNLSPFLIHKTKTQQIRNQIKNTAYNNLHSFRDHRTISGSKKQGLTPLDHEKEKGKSEDRVKFRTKPTIKRKPKNPISSTKDISHLQLYSQGIIDDRTLNLKERIDQLSGKRNDKTFRKNRFQRAETKNSKESGRNKKVEMKQIYNIEEVLLDAKKKQQAQNPQKKAIQRSIEKIGGSLSKKSDNYFDQIDSVDIPSSKIQFYTSIIGQPSPYTNSINYRSNLTEECEGGYDFNFEQEEANPKRKVAFRRNNFEEV